MSRFRRGLVGVGFGVLLIACGDGQVSLRTGPREFTASQYPEVLARWTRSKSLITLADLDDLLTVTATYESWEFRWAYVVRYAQDFRLTVEQRRVLLDKTLAATHDRHNFYVALYGSNRRWSDISRPNSAWIVRLIDSDGNETAPSTIEVIPKPGAIERTYFPYTSVWRQAFRLQFPKSGSDGRPTVAPDASWIGLRFAGAEGNEELRWEIDRSSPKGPVARIDGVDVEL
jgi:hypothetical protein